MRQGNASLTNNETKRFLMQTAEPWGPLLYNYPTPRNYDYGAGRVQALQAVDASGSVHLGGSVANPNHFNITDVLTTTSPIHTWIVSPTNKTWWIAATLIAPTPTEGEGGLVAALTIKPDGVSTNCPALVTNTTAPREAQASYKVDAPCDANTFDVVIASVSGAGKYWLDVTYGGNAPTPQ